MFRWYAINTYSGHENKVKTNLEHRIDSMAQQMRFRRVVVPTEQVVETKDGQKVQTEKRILPGYVLVNMDLNDEAWTVVKNTPGVTGFVGAGSKPVPLSQGEVDRILRTGAATGDLTVRADFRLVASIVCFRLIRLHVCRRQTALLGLVVIVRMLGHDLSPAKLTLDRRPCS